MKRTRLYCRAYLGHIISVTNYDSRHKVMVATKILGRAIVHDVRAMFEWSLKIRTHHSIIHDDNGVGSALFHILTDSCKVDDFE